MDAQFEKLKSHVETELDRPIDQAEEIEVKILYFFGKGVKLKQQLESEPEHIGTILSDVMADIKQRMERNKASEHKKKILAVVGDYMGRNKRRPETNKY
jgi:hypothetical protein